MKLKAHLLLLLQVVFVLVVTGQAQKSEPEIYKGNELYRKQQYDKANEAYQEALAKDPSNPTAHYNNGNASFRQNKFDDALKSFDNTINNTKDKNLQQQSYYNKGVALSKQQKLMESIDAWKEALRMNPNDKQTRENLEKALRELKKKQQEEDQKKNKEKQKKEQQKEKPQPQPKLSQQRVEQLLKALQEKEKEVNAKLNQTKVPAPTKPEKDW
jgi:tetratricopeptide (TPR) repeat protein